MISGLNEKPKRLGYVNLLVRPESDNADSVNIAPKVRVWFAVVPHMHESIIIGVMITVAELVDSFSKFDMVIHNVIDETNAELSAIVNQVYESGLPLTRTADLYALTEINTLKKSAVKIINAMINSLNFFNFIKLLFFFNFSFIFPFV